MNTPDPVSPPLLETLAQTVLSFFPQPIRATAQAALPDLRVLFGRLALEVVDAEQHTLPYAEAIRRPDFHLMSRVYFGATDLLRSQVPPAIRQALRPMLEQAVRGEFESVRSLLFALSRDQTSPEAAVGRFFWWCALLINLRIQTWDIPEVETLGVLRALEARAQQQLESLLETSETDEPDVRPLNVLLAAMLTEAQELAGQLSKRVLEELGSRALEEVLVNAEALRVTRTLDARSAQTLEPMILEPGLGSQQIVDRYGHLYSSVRAMENKRSRVLDKLSQGQRKTTDDRFIDLVRPYAGARK